MKRLFLSLLFVCTVGFPTLTMGFEGMIVQKNTNVPSDVNPAMEAMEKMLQQMPPDQRKMMQEKMKGAMGDRKSEPKVSTQTIYIKGPNMRMELDQAEGEKTFMILDAKKKLVRNCYPDKKAYLEMKIEEVDRMGKGLSDMQKGMGAEKQAEQAGELKKTGEKKKISGYMCERYTQQVGDKMNEYWITKELTMKQIMGDLAESMKSLGTAGGQGHQIDALMKIDGYAILSIIRNKYGTNQNEVVKIEQKSLSDDLFEIPQGYQKQSMGEMMNRKP